MGLVVMGDTQKIFNHQKGILVFLFLSKSEDCVCFWHMVALRAAGRRAELKMSSDAVRLPTGYICAQFFQRFFALARKIMELNGYLVTSAVFYTISRPQDANRGSPF